MNATSSRAYHREIESALEDSFLRRTLDKFAVEYRESRDRAFSEIDGPALISAIAAAKDAAAHEMDALYARFKAEAESRGAVVHLAKTASEACSIIERIAAENGVKHIVKSKSMTAEEIGLNAHLGKAGLDVCETDLGEWIVQLRHEGPSHMVMPAIHLSRSQVADEFEKATGEKQDHEDVQRLVKVARRELRPKFFAAEMGISGANFCIAETGTIAIVTNEGNGRLVNTLPPVHVALAGIDKLIPSLDDALAALRVLPRNATSQRLTAYTSFISGATPCAKSPTGRKILHIVLLDNGRSDIARDPLFSQVFRCVRCGACANVCPVFRLVGGHRMGHVYIGAIGLVLTYLFHDRKIAKQLCQNCVGCGACKEVCSGGIDLPALIQEIRARFASEDGSPAPARIASLAMRDRRAEASVGQGRLRAPSANGNFREAGFQVSARARAKGVPRNVVHREAKRRVATPQGGALRRMRAGLHLPRASSRSAQGVRRRRRRGDVPDGADVLRSASCNARRSEDRRTRGAPERGRVRRGLRLHRDAVRKLCLASEARLRAHARQGRREVLGEGHGLQLVRKRASAARCPAA